MVLVVHCVMCTSIHFLIPSLSLVSFRRNQNDRLPPPPAMAPTAPTAHALPPTFFIAGRDKHAHRSWTHVPCARRRKKLGTKSSETRERKKLDTYSTRGTRSHLHGGESSDGCITHGNSWDGCITHGNNRSTDA